MSGNLKELDSKQSLSERMQDVTETMISLYRKGRPDTDEEVAERLDLYFDTCRFGGLRPAIESLCMALHISRETLRNWKNGIGCSRERQQMIEDARQLVIAEAEQLAFQGALHPGVFAFYMKNISDYRDNPNETPQVGSPFFIRSREEILSSYDATLLEELESEEDENEDK